MFEKKKKKKEVYFQLETQNNMQLNKLLTKN